MTINETRIGDIGTAFRVTVKDQNSTAINISGASNIKRLIFTKPDGSVIERSGTYYTDGSDGVMQYITVSGDLNLSGIWMMQGFVCLTTGSWHTDINSFEVYHNLN